VPSVVGPVRSGRESDVGLLGQYGHVGLAFSGANRHVVPIIDAAPLVDLSPDHADYAYFRDYSRPAPYNLFLHPGELLSHAKHIADVRDVGFRFGPAPSGGTAGTQARVTMSSSVSFGFDYDAASGHYVESIDGEPIKAASGEQQWADNVIVQECDVHPSRFHDVLKNNTPYTTTVGHGRFWLLRDGLAYAGTWSRASAGAPTHYRDASGHDIPLKPGRTWVLLKARGLSSHVS
jgi:hypothetical protein